MMTEQQERDARDELIANQKLVRDQREANAEMVAATIRAHEAIDDAEAARARAEAITNELRESEERYRTLFELSPVAVYSCDRSGVILQFNRHAAQLWGREPASGDTEARFSGAYKLFRPDGSFMPHEQSPMAEVLSGRIPEARDAEVVIERPDESRVTVVVNISPLKNQRGEITAAINCFYDITERKRSEEATARMAAILASSDDAIVSKDLRGVIQSWNQAAQRLFGYTAEETIGKPAVMLIPPDRGDEEPPILERIARGEAVHYETVRQRKDGSDVDISLTVSPVRDRAGRVTGAATIASDITERKLAEKQLADSLHRERELAAFREMFIGVVGHDLRNPLASIVMSAALLLRRGHLDDQDAATATKIIRSSQRMTRLIGQLLDLTRARLGGGLVIEPKPTDMRSLCRDVAEEFDAPIELKVEGDVSGLWDPDRVEEVLSNIVGNAIEHAAPATAVVVDARADGADVVVEISNLGNPIPPDVLPFIFQPFRRARQLEKSATGNLGLGLYIACQIVLSHGGTLDARSENGATTFTMRLPRQYRRDEMVSEDRRP